MGTWYVGKWSLLKAAEYLNGPPDVSLSMDPIKLRVLTHLSHEQ